MIKTHLQICRVLLLTFVLLNTFVIHSQNDSTYFQIPPKKQQEEIRNYDWLEKITIGGNFALFSSTQSAFVDISPIIGYHLSHFVLIGAGPVYNYYRLNQYGRRYTFDMYGFRVLTRAYLMQSLFLQFGWDILNRSIYTFNNNVLAKERIWVQNVWIGGGIRYNVGANTYMFTSALFNLNQNTYSPYPNPYVQIGFITGF